MPGDNVLLITVDSLRADAFEQSMGGSVVERLPELAREGISFTRAFATGPGTGPSFPAILCGSLPLSYGGLGPLSPNRPRIAAHLSDAGLQTGGFHCNPFLSRFFDYDEGFDQFNDYQNPLMGIATKVFPRGLELGNSKLEWLDETLNLTDNIRRAYSFVYGRPRPYVRGEVITDDALEWLRAADSGFFCWTHYMDVHHPCFPPQSYRRRSDVPDVTHQEVAEWYSELIASPNPPDPEGLETLAKLYRASIQYVFDQIERLIACLHRQELLEDTLVIVTSDHGELHGEYGMFGKPARLYDELLHVPLVVVNGPADLRSARSDLVSLLDIPPLIHDTLGLSVPDSYDGRIPGMDPPREYVLAEHEVDGGVIVGARSDEWLYTADEVRDEHRLFRIRNGQTQAVDWREQPGPLRLRDAVTERLAELNVEAARLGDTVSGDVEARLEDLGYL